MTSSRYNILTYLPTTHIKHTTYTYVWVKVLKNGPSEICGRQPLKILK